MAENLEILKLLIDVDTSRVAPQLQYTDRAVKQIHDSLIDVAAVLDRSGQAIVQHSLNQQTALKQVKERALEHYKQVVNWQDEMRASLVRLMDTQKQYDNLSRGQKTRLANQQMQNPDTVNGWLMSNKGGEILQVQRDYVNQWKAAQREVIQLDKLMGQLTAQQRAYGLELAKLDKAGTDTTRLKQVLTEMQGALQGNNNTTLASLTNLKTQAESEIRYLKQVTAIKKAEMQEQLRFQTAMDNALKKAESDQFKYGLAPRQRQSLLPTKARTEQRIGNLNERLDVNAQNYEINVKQIKAMGGSMLDLEKETANYNAKQEKLTQELSLQKQLLQDINKEEATRARLINVKDRAMQKAEIEQLRFADNIGVPPKQGDLLRAMTASKKKQVGLRAGIKDQGAILESGIKNLDPVKDATAIANAERDHDKAVAALNAQLKVEVENYALLNNQYQSARKKLYDIQNAATTVFYVFGALATGMGAFLKRFADAFGDMEAKLNTFKSVTFEAGESIDLIDQRGEAFRKTVIEISKGSRFAASEIVEASTELGKMGFSVQDITNSLHGIVTAAEASGESLGTVAETVSSVLNQFNMDRTVENVQKVTDILSYVANKTAASFSSLNEALKYVGPIANAAGESLSDTAAILGFLSDRSIQGSGGATVLTNTFLRLAKITPEVSKVLQAMGVQAFDPLTKKQKQLKDILIQLSEAQKGMGTSTKLASDELIVGERGAKGLAAILTKIADDKEGFLTYLDDVATKSKGMTDAVKEVGFRGFQKEVEELQHSFDALAQEMGEDLAPAFTMVVQGAKSLVEAVSAIPDHIRTEIALMGVFTTGLLGVAAAGGLLVKSVTGIYQAMTFLAPAIEAVKVQLAGVLFEGGSIEAAFAGIMAAPLLPWILGITAAVAALSAILYLNKDAWEAEREEQAAEQEHLAKQIQLRTELIGLIQKEASGHRLNAEELMKEAAGYKDRANQARARLDALAKENDELRNQMTRGAKDESGGHFGVRGSTGNYRQLTSEEVSAAQARIQANEDEAKSLQHIAAGYEDLAGKTSARGAFQKSVDDTKNAVDDLFQRITELKRIESSSQNDDIRAEAQKELNRLTKDEYIPMRQKLNDMLGQTKEDEHDIRLEIEQAMLKNQEVGDQLGQNQEKDKDILDILKLQNEQRQIALDLLNKELEIQDNLAYGKTLGIDFGNRGALPELTPVTGDKKLQQMAERSILSDANAKALADKAEKESAEKAGLIGPPNQGVESLSRGASGMASMQVPEASGEAFQIASGDLDFHHKPPNLQGKSPEEIQRALYNSPRAQEIRAEEAARQRAESARMEREDNARTTSMAGEQASGILDLAKQYRKYVGPTPSPVRLTDLSSTPSARPVASTQPGYGGSFAGSTPGTGSSVNASLFERQQLATRVAETKAAHDQAVKDALQASQVYEQKRKTMHDDASKKEAEQAFKDAQTAYQREYDTWKAFQEAKIQQEKRLDQDQIARDQRAHDRRLKELEIEALQAEQTYKTREDDIRVQHETKMEQLKNEFEAENSQIYKLYDVGDERDKQLAQAQSDYDKKRAIEQLRYNKDVYDETVRLEKRRFDIQQELQGKLIDLMPEGLNKQLKEIQASFDKTIFDLNQRITDPATTDAERANLVQQKQLAAQQQDMQIAQARLAEEGKILDVQNQQLDVLIQKSKLATDILQISRDLSQDINDSGLTEIFGAYREATKAFKQVDFGEVKQQFDTTIKQQDTLLEKQTALINQQKEDLIKRYQQTNTTVIKRDGVEVSRSMPTREEAQEALKGTSEWMALEQKVVAIEDQRNDLVQARLLLGSKEFEQYAKQYELLNRMKEAYSGISDTFSAIAQYIPGFDGLNKAMGSALSLYDKASQLPLKLKSLQDQADQDRSNRAGGIGPEGRKDKAYNPQVGGSGIEALITRGIGTSAAAGSASAVGQAGAMAGASMGTAAAAAFPPAMLLALLPLLPDIVNVIGEAFKGLTALMMPDMSPEIQKWKRDQVDTLNELLDQRDRILFERGDMSEALFNANTLDRIGQKYANKVKQVQEDIAKQKGDIAGEGGNTWLKALSGVIPMAALWTGIAGSQGDASRQGRMSQLDAQQKAQEELLKQQQKQEANKANADIYRQSRGKEMDLQYAANDATQIAAALSHSKQAKIEADYAKQKLDNKAKENEAYAKLLEDPESLQAQALYNQQYANLLKEQEQIDQDHNQQMDELQAQRNKTQRDLDLEAIQTSMSKTEHDKKVAEIQTTLQDKLADIALRRKYAESADLANLNQEELNAYAEAAKATADEAERAANAITDLNNALAASRAALNPGDKTQAAKASLDADLEGIHRNAQEQRKLYAAGSAERAKIDETELNQRAARNREFNQQVLDNQIEISQREGVIKQKEYEQQGKVELAARQEAMVQAERIINELEAYAEANHVGPGNPEYDRKTKEAQNQLYDLALQQYQKLADLRQQELDDIVQLATLKAQNAKDTMGAVVEETKGKIQSLALERYNIQQLEKDDKRRAQKLALNDEKVKAARLEGIKQEGDASIEQLNQIKQIRQEILDAATRTYELDIQANQFEIDKLNQQIDQATARKHQIEADIAAKERDFNSKDANGKYKDRTLFDQALAGKDLSKEMASALEYVSNPIKNQPLSYSYQATLDAAQASADVRERGLEVAYDTRDINQSQFNQGMQESALQRALLAQNALSKIDAQDQAELKRLQAQGKTTDELRVVEKHQQDDKLKALEFYQKAFDDWRTYYKASLADQNQDELTAIDQSVAANQDKVTALEDQNKLLGDNITQLTDQAKADLRNVDDQILKIQQSTRGWGFSVDDVKTKMADLVKGVVDGFNTMSTAITSIPATVIPVSFPDSLPEILRQLKELPNTLSAVKSQLVSDSYSPYSSTPVASGYSSQTIQTPSVTSAEVAAANVFSQLGPYFGNIGFADGGYTGSKSPIGDKLLAALGYNEFVVPERDFRSYSDDLIQQAIARNTMNQSATIYAPMSFGNVYGVEDLQSTISGAIKMAAKDTGFNNASFVTGIF